MIYTVITCLLHTYVNKWEIKKKKYLIRWKTQNTGILANYIFFLTSVSLESPVMIGTGTVAIVEKTVNSQVGHQETQSTNQDQQFKSFQADINSENISKPLKCLPSNTLAKINTDMNGFDIKRRNVFLICIFVMLLAL